MFLLRQLNKLKVNSKILCLYYNAMISSAAPDVISSWYNSCIAAALPYCINRHGLRSKLPNLLESHQTLFTPGRVYKSFTTASTKITAESQLLLHSYFKWLPNGIRLSSPFCRTNWNKDTTVPSFTRLFNEDPTRSSQDESELDP